MDIEVRVGALHDQAVGALIVGHFESESTLDAGNAHLDSALGESLAEVLRLGDVKGTRGELTLVHTFGRVASPRILLMGLGKRDELTLDVIRTITAELARYLRRRGIQQAAMEALGVAGGLDAEDVGRVIAEGIGLGLYRFRRHKSTQADEKEPERLIVVAPDEGLAGSLEHGVATGTILAAAANFARDLENEPSNYMTPTDLASHARQAADEGSFECQILDGEDMVELGMGALLGVAKGSHEEPKFIVMSYRGDPGTDRAIGLIGKGVTFDTGGISIKPAQGMEEMKGDMSGGASVIATLRALALLRPRINVTGIVPATENMPGGAAIKPGDVLVAMNGKTIEVINTDAEGRLILADALSYARKLDLAPIIDVATLTGAISVALGDVAMGVFANDQTLVAQLMQAGAEAGEKLWQLPMFDEYREQIKSEIADIKNTGGRKAGSITAALFLAEFAESTPWAHLDIAGVDTYDRERGWTVKGASGIPVRTLIHFVLDRARENADRGTVVAADAVPAAGD